MKCATCGGLVMAVLELDGYERRCVMCGREPEEDLEGARAAAARAEKWMEGKSRRRQPSIHGLVL